VPAQAGGKEREQALVGAQVGAEKRADAGQLTVGARAGEQLVDGVKENVVAES
jgi:hypothetical protein